jgi:hypothetical protein
VVSIDMASWVELTSDVREAVWASQLRNSQIFDVIGVSRKQDMLPSISHTDAREKIEL